MLIKLYVLSGSPKIYVTTWKGICMMHTILIVAGSHGREMHVSRMLFQEDSNRCCADTVLTTNVPTAVSACCWLRSETFTADNFGAHKIPKLLTTIFSKPVQAGSNTSQALALPLFFFFSIRIVSNYFSN